MNRPPGATPDLEVEVARHREDLAWTRNLPAGVRVTVYDAGGDLDPARLGGGRIVRIPDRGHEEQAYLTHLVERHATLAATTVFVQGHPFDHAHDLHPVLRRLAAGAERVEGFRWLGFIIDTDDPRGRRLFVPWSKNPDRRELRLDEFHRALLGEPAPERLRFHPGAQFAVSRECAQARPAGFYARARELAAATPDAGHCLERMWDRVFGVVGVDETVLAGGDTRYLKPVRRLREG